MKLSLSILPILAVLFSSTPAARAQESGASEQAIDSQDAVAPPTTQPTELPPPPPAQIPQPSPQVAQPIPQPVAQAPAGQWVYTQQYGWLWMPYGEGYTSVPAGAGLPPQEFVYYPSYGWTWVAAPWMWGWGARPFFGTYGYARFRWYRPAYFAHRGYGYGYGHPGPVFRGPGRPVFRGAPVRAYGPARVAAPAFRGGGARGGYGYGHAGRGSGHR